MKCTATSSQTGLPCKRPAIRGGTVCTTHGGSAPQVKRKALERIQDAADLVAQELVRIALHGDSENVRVAAARDLLDRAGLNAKQLIESEVTIHGQDDFARAVADLEAELARGGQSRGAVAEDEAAPSG